MHSQSHDYGVFCVDSGSPDVLASSSYSAEDFADAIQHVFPMETSNALLVWQGVNIPLNYKYDVSVIVEDVVGMLEVLLPCDSGVFQFWFGSDTFGASFLMRVNGDILSIRAVWDSVSGANEAVLNDASDLVVSKSLFISNWLKIIRIAAHGVSVSGVFIENDVLLRRAVDLLDLSAP